MLKKIFLITWFLLPLGADLRAQEKPANREDYTNREKKVAVKIAEYGAAGECERSAIADLFFSALAENPDATGYVINYQGENVLPAEYESSLRARQIRQAIAFRRFDASRIVFIGGGFRSEAASEFWLVPTGADKPTPTDTVPKPALPKNKTYLHDNKGFTQAYEEEDSILSDFILPHVKAEIAERQRLDEEEWEKNDPQGAAEYKASLASEVENPPEEPTREELDEARFFWLSGNFGDAIKHQKGARGVIIFYADDLYFDVNKLHAFIDEGRRKIAGDAKIPIEKIQVLFGGYRDRTQAEFWIVPKKGEPPIPTPEQRKTEDEAVKQQ